MKKLTFSKAFFPNSATALNIICGFLSIVYASNSEFKIAALLIFSAAFFDLLDGIIARITRSSSMFGVELDSLADIISFGAAPAFLIYKSYLIQYGLAGILISSLLVVFGAFRLARFNVQIEDISTKLDFKGLPVPVTAITFASIILFYHNGITIIKPFSQAVIPLVLLLSFLMVSNIRYNAVPKVKYLNTFSKFALILLSLAALLSIVLTQGVAFFYLVLTHIVFGILRYLYEFVFDQKTSRQLT